jgi:two-component system phosphate regulon sensor histidine kinase PhoR
VRFRTRVFLATFGVAALSLLAAASLASWSFRRHLLEQLQSSLVSEARMVARLVAGLPAGTTPEALDAEADAVGRLLRGRVTFIAADGRVVGDSLASGDELARLENHGSRPEVVAARRTGLGVERRWSTTANAELLYAAVRVDHGPVAVVRLALPVSAVADRVWSSVATGAFSLVVAIGGALILAWVSSRLLSRRLDGLVDLARRHADGEAPARLLEPGRDEIGLVARVLDETARAIRRRVEELERDRARMAAILAGMVEGVLVVNEAGEVQLVNEAARRMLQLDDGAIGRSYLELVRHPDVAAEISRALDGEPSAGLELSLGREPGQVFIARTAPVSSAAGRGAVLVLHDITDLRRADRIRRDFVANVSHELRTPLTAIRGYVEALLDAPPGSGDERRFLEIVARHAWRMERLVQDLLRLARLDAGQEPLERAPCETARLVEGVLAELQPAIEARRQTVRLEIAPEAREVVGDAAKLHDVLRNLLENASNYAPEGSAITVRAAIEPGWHVLQVLDEGPGIPEADLSRVFERFYRVDKARSRDTGGTGLGLSIVRHLVDLHGGRVSAANRPEGGAVFTVRLPAFGAADSAVRASAPE